MTAVAEREDAHQLGHTLSDREVRRVAYSEAYRLRLPSEAVEEVVAEVLVRVWKGPSEVSIRKLVRWEAIDRARRKFGRRGQRPRTYPVDTLPEERHDEDHQVGYAAHLHGHHEDDLELVDMADALDRLGVKPRDRDLLLGLAAGERKGEVAHRWEVTPAAITHRVTRLRRRDALRRTIEEDR